MKLSKYLPLFVALLSFACYTYADPGPSKKDSESESEKAVKEEEKDEEKEMKSKAEKESKDEKEEKSKKGDEGKESKKDEDSKKEDSYDSEDVDLMGYKGLKDFAPSGEEKHEDEGELEDWYNPPPSSLQRSGNVVVPDSSSTLALLATGIVGFVLFRRFTKK